MKRAWIVLIVVLSGCRGPDVVINVFAEKEWRTEGQSHWAPADTRSRVEASIQPFNRR
jgi:hypothetical protein